MEDKTFAMIKELTELQGTSGNERNIRNYMRERMAPLVDRIETDGLGGIFGIREHEDKTAPRIMVAAHMDEVGFHGVRHHGSRTCSGSCRSEVGMLMSFRHSAIRCRRPKAIFL